MQAKTLTTHNSMDPVALKSNTSIDMGEVGFTLNSNKPTFSGGVETVLPPIGFYNPNFDFQKYLNRFFLLDTKVFTSTSKRWYWELLPSNLTTLDNFTSIKDLFVHGDQNGIWPTGLKFLFVIHSPFNVNGVMAAYHNPSNEGVGSYTDILDDQLDDVSSVNETIVKAMNLKGVMCSLAQAREIELTVPLNYPVNIPRTTHRNHGGVTLEIITDDIYFGSGINSISADIYVAPLGVLTAPLNGS